VHLPQAGLLLGQELSQMFGLGRVVCLCDPPAETALRGRQVVERAQPVLQGFDDGIELFAEGRGKRPGK
jgi:hypothetical protein